MYWFYFPQIPDNIAEFSAKSDEIVLTCASNSRGDETRTRILLHRNLVQPTLLDNRGDFKISGQFLKNFKKSNCNCVRCFYQCAPLFSQIFLSYVDSELSRLVGPIQPVIDKWRIHLNQINNNKTLYLISSEDSSRVFGWAVVKDVYFD